MFATFKKASEVAIELSKTHRVSIGVIRQDNKFKLDIPKKIEDLIDAEIIENYLSNNPIASDELTRMVEEGWYYDEDKDEVISPIQDDN